MPKVSEAHLQARRRGILAAAQRCVSRKGIAATTMRDICRAANLSPGGVYRYFSGKKEILEALAEERDRQVRRFFQRLTSESPSRAETLRRLADLVRRLDAESAQDGLRLDLHLWSEALGPQGVALGSSERQQELVELLARSLSGDSELSRGSIARLVLALLQGLAVQKALEPTLDLSALARRLETLLAT